MQLQKQLDTEEFEFVNSLLEAIDKTIPKDKKVKKTIRIFEKEDSYKTIELEY